MVLSIRSFVSQETGPLPPRTASETEVLEGPGPRSRGLGVGKSTALSPTDFISDPELLWFLPRPRPCSENEGR